MWLGNKIKWKLKKIANKHATVAYLMWIYDNRSILRRGNYFVLVGTPVHGNLGDQAIALAEYQFLRKCNSDKDVLEIPSKLVSSIHKYKKWIGKRDVLVHGGGFIGTLWIEEEYLLRNIILSFPDNGIIILPQTITFSDDDTGKLELQKSKDIFEQHNNLIICTREKMSFDFAKSQFKKTESLLIPDMVLQMKLELGDTNRSGCLLCLRADHEKKLTDKERTELVNKCNCIFDDEVSFTDTNDAIYVDPANREEAVSKKMREFKKAKLVVTDRLHGMVFAALTGTPCIALGNSNGKVGEVYKWIDNLDYLEYIDSLKDFDDVAKRVLNSKNKQYNYDSLETKYSSLQELLNK